VTGVNGPSRARGSQGQAPVDDELGPGHERAVRGGEEQHGPRDLLGGTAPTPRLPPVTIAVSPLKVAATAGVQVCGCPVMRALPRA
jgi:hypothetical protein